MHSSTKKTDPNKENSYLKKLKTLTNDKRTYKNRLVVSASVNLALVFTFLFFGPIELAAGSIASLDFTIVHVLKAMSMISIVAFAALGFLLPLLKGRIFNFVITAEIAVLICGYIQGNFLNGYMGVLDGDAIIWYEKMIPMVINLVILAVIGFLPFVLLFFNKKLWSQAVTLVSLALVVMQAVALITILPTAFSYVGDAEENYLTPQNMYNYSQDSNVIVFVLDRFDYDIVDMMLEKDPGFFDGLDGFTSYTNAISEHARTSPAGNYMLTNNDNAFKVPARQFFEEAWGQDNLLRDLSDHDYEVNVYAEIASMFGDGLNAKDYVANMDNTPRTINNRLLIERMVKLSAYRYAPVALKPFFWTFTEEVNREIYANDEVYVLDETKFDQNIHSIATQKGNQFKYYHFNGAHPPFILDENGKKNGAETDYATQTMGSMSIVYRAIQKMKELDIYKDATILILADHGIIVSDSQAVQKATRIALFYKPAGVEGIPLEESKAPVSFKNIPATLAKGAGLDYAKYGRPLDAVGEEESIERFHYKSSVNAVNGKRQLYTYSIKGDAAFFENWEQISCVEIDKKNAV